MSAAPIPMSIRIRRRLPDIGSVLLITFVELSAAPVWLVHLLGLLLLAGRVLHVYGVGREPENFRMRTWAMVLTFTVLAIAAVQLLTTTLIRWIIAA